MVQSVIANDWRTGLLIGYGSISYVAWMQSDSMKIMKIICSHPYENIANILFGEKQSRFLTYVPYTVFSVEIR